ncbi:MAG: HAD family hydrolase [Clostridia bacterium]|nr:HAD family hydrolase [Clostridia bacterium]
MNLKAVIFDLDGTIADTIPLTVFSLKEVTKELTNAELSDEEILAKFGPIDTEIIRTLVDNDNKEIAAEKYVQHFSTHFESFVKPMDGIKELLKYLKSKNIKVGLFTGRSQRVTHIILEKLDVKQYFDEILAGDHTKKPKPDPEGILLTLDKLKVSSNESAYVGDFDVDVLASKAAGTLLILALWSSTGNRNNIKCDPDQYFDSPYGFIHWLERNE